MFKYRNDFHYATTKLNNYLSNTLLKSSLSLIYIFESLGRSAIMAAKNCLEEMYNVQLMPIMFYLMIDCMLIIARSMCILKKCCIKGKLF